MQGETRRNLGQGSAPGIGERGTSESAGGAEIPSRLPLPQVGPVRPHSWSVVLPGSTVRIGVAPVEVDRHAELIHDWMNRPHVVPWWQLDRPLDDVRAYLRGLTHLQPWLVAADGVPFGYVETYRATEDPLSSHYRARPTDVGWHLLVGPQEFIGTGTPRLLGRAMLAYLLGVHDDARSDGHRHRGDRVVCEPDIRNTRMHAYCRKLGFRSIGEAELPDKKALLMACERTDFTRAWPGDARPRTGDAHRAGPVSSPGGTP
ncbi:GNAT family N-acetyltransferase [Phytoactinopolyspora mesophila]|uniref:Lysine N-acyltransferase MbtK n=1 Tax=Phytoactinopolyspora mesophila TaxID=2650750 RepID=A0A7K3MBE4_9ACTN|nr:GNAT family N-acetyltransferase [Phytoactinopolyspora mesophila]NDL60624.1 GNAT family N-acetyltransferase [Phytoactinopolyspora mesophila]